MADQRIKGQEVEVLMVVNGKAQDTITDVRAFEMTVKLDLLQEGYLGETTDRYDEIFKGVSGKLDLHFENQDIFNFFQSVTDRARRREPGVKINMKATLNFPNGQRPRVAINDCFFEAFPMGFGSRADYGMTSLSFSASDYRVITT